MRNNINLPISRTGAHGTTLAGLALLFLAFGGTAQAAEYDFTFSFEPTAMDPGLGATLTLLGAPTAANPVPETLMGTGSFGPFGLGTLNETGFVTFVPDGMGGFFPAFINNNVTVTFAAFPGLELFATNHITFTPGAMGAIDLTTLATVSGGTGIFTGASGFTLATGVAIPDATGATATFAGYGMVSTPEPVTTWFLAIGLVGLAGAAKIRKRA